MLNLKNKENDAVFDEICKQKAMIKIYIVETKELKTWYILNQNTTYSCFFLLKE